jgi:predicted permease
MFLRKSATAETKVSEDKSHAFAVWSAFRNPVFWAPLLGVVIAVIQFHVPVYVEKGLVILGSATEAQRCS